MRYKNDLPINLDKSFYYFGEHLANIYILNAVISMLSSTVLRRVQDLNLRAKEYLVRRISSPVHYHSANSPQQS